MLRTATAVLVLALATAAGTVYLPDAFQRSRIDVDALLGRPSHFQTAMQVSLNPPGSATSAAFDFRLPSGSFLSQEHESDGERIDTYLRADKSRLARLEYYAAKSEGVLPLLKHGLVYADDGSKKVGETAFNLSGVRTSWGLLQADGSYRMRDYFADGVMVAREAYFVPNMFATNYEPDMVREDSYREDKTLFSENILNDDGTRTITWYDRQKQVLKVKHVGIHPVLSSMVAYWPGTKSVRMNSTSDAQDTEATFRRLDGTISSKIVITTFSMTAQYFDARGEKVLYTQLWNLSRDGAQKTSFNLWHEAELDGNGSEKRDLDFDNGALKNDGTNKGTKGGIIAQTTVTLTYRDDGTLGAVEFNQGSAISSSASKADLAAASLHSQIQPQELKADLGEDLPLPPAPPPPSGHN